MSDIITLNNTNLNENFCLIFSLLDKLYGISVENVLEIVNIPKLDAPQKMPKHILGVMTYNNISLKVVDLCSVLSHNKPNYSIDAQVIIVKTEESLFGIITDKVVDVKAIEADKIQPLPYHSEENLVQYLYRLNENFVSVIDLNSVQNVVLKTQHELSEYDISEIFPQDEKSKSTLEKRHNDLIKKFDSNIKQIYHDQEQYVVFSLGKNLYALSIKNVQEISGYKNIPTVSLPKKYDYIEGIINLRGDFISLIDFKKFLNIESTTDDSDSKMLIVFKLKDFKIAILIDNILDIITISSNDIITKFDNKFESKFINGELHLNGQVISIISTDKILTDERLYIKD